MLHFILLIVSQLEYFILFVTFNTYHFIGEFVIGCYYTNWSQHRKEEVKFLPKNIDPTLCTHAYYAFANIDTDKMALSTFERNDISDTPDTPVVKF